MLKVIHSCPVWLPQTQTWIYNQVKQLQRSGVEAHVVCHRTENLDQFAVANIHCQANDSFYKQVWEKGLRKLRIRRYPNNLVEVGKSVDADLVHSHFGDVAWVNLGAIRRLRAKHFVTFYGFDVNKLPIQQPVWRQRYLQLFSEADLFLCEGTHMAQCLIGLGCPDHKVRVQHLGVNVDNMIFRPRQWDPTEPLRVLIAASFREKKGIPYAIKALQTVAEKVPVFLTIIGDAGRDQESQQEKVKILKALDISGLRKNTRMLGYQTHRSMMQEAYDHHLFLQPSVTASHGDTEGGAPVSIIEMLATGMPVVATTHCDIPEVVGPAYSHLLASERNSEHLAECIQTLLHKPDSWPNLLQKGREHVENNYHLPGQVDRLIACYDEIVCD